MLYGYARVSTAEQVNGSSLAEQDLKVRGVAMMRGTQVDRIFIDAGVSGSIPLAQRPQGRELAARLRPGDTLVVAKLDRVFRSAADALNTVDAWKQLGIALIVADMGSDPVTESGVSKLFFGMLALVAEFERERIRERVQDGKKAKKATGGHLGGQRPFGYRVIGQGREARLEPIPEEQAAIQDMRALRQQGTSLRTIAATLQARGFRISHVTVGTLLAHRSATAET